jgi:hypothetical protein
MVVVVAGGEVRGTVLGLSGVREFGSSDWGCVMNPTCEQVLRQEFVNHHRGGADQAGSVGQWRLHDAQVAGSERRYTAWRMAASRRSPEAATPPPIMISDGL